MSNLSGIKGRAPITRELSVEGDSYLQKTTKMHESMDGTSEGISDEIDESLSSGGEGSPHMTRRDFLNMSKSVPRTPKRPPRMPLRTSPSKPPADQSSYHEEASTVKPKSAMNSILLMVVVVAMGLVCGFLYSKGDPINVVKECSFAQLKLKYPQQKDSTWDTISYGIERILNQNSHAPGVYLFVHQPQVQGVLPLIRNIATHSSKCFSKEMKPIEMDKEDFQSSLAIEDYGYAIKKYKSHIHKGNVTLILNLNDIPAEAARALHTICDTITPLVENVVIFMSLEIPLNKEKAIQNAHDTLNMLWGPVLASNELDPLITRVTDQVIQLV